MSTKRAKRKRISLNSENSLETPLEDREHDFLCPICLSMINEAYMTQCGHSFCKDCIESILHKNNRCPTCFFAIEKKDQIYPNFFLNELISKHKMKVKEYSELKQSCQSGVYDQLYFAHDYLDLGSVNHLIEMLTSKKMKLEGENKKMHSQLLLEFLEQVHRGKQEKINELMKQLHLISDDIKFVQEKLSAENSPSSPFNSKTTHQCDGGVPDSNSEFEELKRQYLHSTMASRRKIVSQHFEDLEKCYFSIRQKDLFSYSIKNDNDISMRDSKDTLKSIDSINCVDSPASTTFSENDDKDIFIPKSQSYSHSPYHKVSNYLDEDFIGIIDQANTAAISGSSKEQIYNSIHNSDDNCLSSHNKSGSLQEFTESLCKFTNYTACRPLASLNYSMDIYNTSSIVSSVEFDRDCDYFAIAGVTKKIKVFEYSSVIGDALDVHYPVNEMVCNSKISSIIWSSYHKGMLASSDYEGTVTLWDVFAGVKSKIFQEHEKRCWSVDFNKMDPNLLASGSDDSKVKLWYTNQERSVSSIEAKANVCCVKFNPESRYHLAFGSADHCVHYYDLRNTRRSLQVFKGHRKAVSYTKFVNNNEIVSASTDSQLKLWTLDKSYCTRTFQGHSNEKNFIGLATDNGYIACGSEDNSLYIYYKGLCKQLLTFKFDTVKSILEKDKKEDDSNEFVSAVCWKPNSNIIVAANSQGIVKVLELV